MSSDIEPTVSSVSDHIDFAVVRLRMIDECIAPFNNAINLVIKGLSASNQTQSLLDITKICLDPLPSDGKKLETKLNTHIGELNLLKMSVRCDNDDILREQLRLQGTYGQIEGHMPLSVEVKIKQINMGREYRDSKKQIMIYHLQEIRRCAERRLQLADRAGMEPVLPSIYENVAKNALTMADLFT